MRCALATLFNGAIGKDVVSRVWRKVQGDWQAWNNRPLADEPIMRLILNGTVVRVRPDRKATSISLSVVLGIREDGHKMLLAVKQMDGETAEAYRRFWTISSGADCEAGLMYPGHVLTH